jgi:hypothetical protein
LKSTIGIGLVILATTLLGCAPRADDLLALGAEAEQVATRVDGAPAFAESEVGVDGEWTLVLVSNSASSESLRGTGLSADNLARIDGRSKSFKEANCVVFISHGTVAFAEWPETAGVLTRSFAITGNGRRRIQVHLKRVSNRPEVIDLMLAP